MGNLRVTADRLRVGEQYDRLSVGGNLHRARCNGRGSHILRNTPLQRRSEQAHAHPVRLGAYFEWPICPRRIEFIGLGSRNYPHDGKSRVGWNDALIDLPVSAKCPPHVGHGQQIAIYKPATLMAADS